MFFNSSYRLLVPEIGMFNRNAFNFVIGNFGMKQAPMICVQSVDGALFFLQQDTQIFQIQLSNFLIPGPIAYCGSSDSVIIANSNLEVESYKFTSLQTTGRNNIDQQKEAQAKDENAGKVEPDWVANLGEHPAHIKVHENAYSSQSDLVVACETTVLILTDKGKIRF